MRSEAIKSPRDDGGNPFEAPQTDIGRGWGTGDPGAEAIRRANQADEAYIKAVAVLNLAIAAIGAAWAFTFFGYALQHATGQINAPWIAHFGWIALQVDLWVLTIAAAAAFVGFWRLRRWAFPVELCCLLSLTIYCLIDTLNHPRMTILEFLANSCLILCLATPMLNLADVRQSLVFNPDYQAVRQATSYIRVRPKLPRDLQIFTALFLAGAMVCVYFAFPNR